LEPDAVGDVLQVSRRVSVICKGFLNLVAIFSKG
jgi:hypothetical protein